MKWRVVSGLFALGVILTARTGSAQTAFSVSADIGNFRAAVSNYYRVPEREIVVIRERRISEDEIPVVLFVAQRARVTPATVIALRESGRSWWDISVHFGLGPEVYYVPVVVTPGPPYGKAYGHYKEKSRQKWNTIVLADDDVVNLVHLRFLSEHYGVPPERVIEARRHQTNFVLVNAEIGRHGRSVPKSDDRDGGRGDGHGKRRGN